MNIVHIVYGLSNGGIETMLVNITHFQSLEGHDVHIVIINDIIEPSLLSRISPTIRVHQVGRRQGSKNPLPVLKFNQIVYRLHPDIIHLHSASISKYIFIPGMKKKMCVTLHGLCNDENTKGIKSAGRVFSISESVRKDLFEKFGLDSKTIYNGIDTEKIVSRVNEKLNDCDDVKIVQVARLVHEIKGQDVLIKAIAKLKEDNRRVKLTIIGEGPSMEYLQELAGELGVSDCVEFLGNKTQDFVLSHLSDYDIYVHPSRKEGFGLAVAEAMAAGLPVVVSDNNGPMEVIDNGRYGFSFKDDNADECAKQIAYVIDHYPSKSDLEAIRTIVKDKYEVRRTAQRYLDEYSRILRK